MEVQFTFRGLRPPLGAAEMFNVQCGTCSGEGAVFRPRLGWTSDGNIGTVHAPMDCVECEGAGWIAAAPERDQTTKKG